MNEEIDVSDLRKVILESYKQLPIGYELGKDVRLKGTPNHIIVAGMGGSALPGEVLASYAETNLPITIVRRYTVPAFVNEKTLVFAISYSGNTEEALSAFQDARKKGAQIVVITTGGKLKELAKTYRVPTIIIPSGIQPRFAVGYMFGALMRVLSNSGVAPDISAEIKKTSTILKKPGYEDQGRKLAGKLSGKIPIIYSSDRMKAVSYKWKISFNECSKVHAFTNTFAELNHNEMVGYTDLHGDYFVIILRDEADHIRVRKRMDLTKKLITGKGTPVIEIGIKGSSRLAKIFSAIHVGDWTSYYLALSYGTDPTPVTMIEKLKKDL